MKSYLSRFLHYILSHSDVKPQSTPSLSHSDLIGVSRSNKFAALSNLDIRVKPEYDNIGLDASLKPDNDNIVNAGRSMVEMLGVLAIIGVLSVGAIAGYSKAMMKYKLNKQAEQISWLLNVLYRYKDMFGHSKGYFVPYLKTLNEIPQEMIKANDSHIYDTFGFLYYINTDNCTDEFCRTSTLLIQSPTNYKNFDVCHNIFETAKAFSAQLYYFSAWSGEAGGLDYLYGDTYCSSVRKCLKDLSQNGMYEICKNCAEKSCNFYFKYEIK